MSNETESIKDNASSNLSNLQEGAMIRITQGNNVVYVAPIGLPGGTVYGIANGTPPEGSISTFVLTTYSSSGDQTKVSLQPLGMEGFWWTAGQNIADVPYPIILGPEPETFILSGSIDGTTIQYTVSPPGPYIHGYDTGVELLTYGHDQPLIQGLFDIEVVG